MIMSTMKECMAGLVAGMESYYAAHNSGM